MNTNFKGEALYCNKDTYIQFESLRVVFSVVEQIILTNVMNQMMLLA
jgi:hypothetical protein